MVLGGCFAAASSKILPFYIRTSIVVLMTFKRNQIEEALSRLREPRARRPSARLRTQLKRFLEIDRAQGRSARPTAGSSRYAFFSADPPGRGVEVYFSDYEAFALLLAFELMHFGWTQYLAVSILRRARVELERQFLEMKERRQKDPSSLPNFEAESPLLVIITAADDAMVGGVDAVSFAVCKGYRKAMTWVFNNSERTQGFSMIELPLNALKLRTELARTEPRRRGKSG
jgi:hypothetical protein